MDATPAKQCTKCGEVLPVVDFHRSAASPDGRVAVCRRCANLAKRSVKQASRGVMRAAIKAGDFEKVRELLDHTRLALDQMLPIAVQDYNTSKKHDGHARIVDLLIAKGANPHWSLLFETARTGDQRLTDHLVAGGAAFNIFSCAALGERVHVQRLLLKNPELATSTTPVSTQNYRAFTPLHCCCLSALGRGSRDKGQQLCDIGGLLLEHGADVNAVGTFYKTLNVTPLDMAAHTGGNFSLIELLLRHGARITSFGFCEALSHRGRTPEDGFRLAKLFLQSGFDINASHRDGSLLHRIANSGDVTVVRWLLEHGADVNARGHLGRTPLHLAAERNDTPNVARVLAEHGALLDARDDLGMTPREVAQRYKKRALERWFAEQPG